MGFISIFLATRFHSFFSFLECPRLYTGIKLNIRARHLASKTSEQHTLYQVYNIASRRRKPTCRTFRCTRYSPNPLSLFSDLAGVATDGRHKFQVCIMPVYPVPPFHRRANPMVRCIEVLHEMHTVCIVDVMSRYADLGVL